MQSVVVLASLVSELAGGVCVWGGGGGGGGGGGLKSYVLTMFEYANIRHNSK